MGNETLNPTGTTGTHGGARPGAGRPKGPKKYVVQVSLTAIERNRFTRLGGSRWLKRKLAEEFQK